MKVTTLRLPDDLLERLDDEYSEYGYSSRSEYVRWLLERRDRIHENTATTEDTPAYSDRDTLVELTDRVDKLEARLKALEERPQADELAVGAQSSAAPEASAQRATSVESDHAPEASVATDPDAQRVLEAFRDYLDGRPPEMAHTTDAVVDALAILRREGTIATSDLRSELFEQYGEHYSSEKSMWDTMNRYLSDLPGFGKPGRGVWQYEGDGVVLEEVAED
jgi:Arc/MetJ-type ribon-helix-helix transcriptional regulator